MFLTLDSNPTSMDKIKLFDKTFRPYIPNEEVEKAIDRAAERVRADFENSGTIPVFLCVLNGAIMFTAAMMKRLSFPAEFVSIKSSSYIGTKSGAVNLVGLTGDIKGRSVIIFEDVVDTGNTIEALRAKLLKDGAAEVRVCTLFFKPNVFAKDFPIDYVGMNISNEFIVGCGLDYNELGRNLKDIYIIDEQ